MKEIIFSTHNNHKLKEVQEIVKDIHYSDAIKIISLEQLNVTLEPEETHLTYRGNSELKAVFYGNLLKKSVVADDSGFEVKTLGNFPGVASARWMKNKPYNEKCKKILEMFRETKSDNRDARFVASVCFYDYNHQKKYFFDGYWNGSISSRQKGTNNFGYDPIFVDKIFRLTASELPTFVKNSISHRREAMEKFLTFFHNYEN